MRPALGLRPMLGAGRRVAAVQQCHDVPLLVGAQVGAEGVELVELRRGHSALSQREQQGEALLPSPDVLPAGLPVSNAVPQMPRIVVTLSTQFTADIALPVGRAGCVQHTSPNMVQGPAEPTAGLIELRRPEAWSSGP